MRKNRNLKIYKNIIIKSADKGSAIVVWNREDYLKEAQEQLADEDIYEEVHGDPSPNLAIMISNALQKIEDLGVLDHETLQFLKPEELDWVVIICFQKFIKDFTGYQVALSYPILAISQKIFQLFWITICSP